MSDEQEVRTMSQTNPKLNRACEFVAAMIDWEIAKRRRFNRNFNPDEVWASVTHDATIHVVTPLLHPGEGFYVNYFGNRWEV